MGRAPEIRKVPKRRSLQNLVIIVVVLSLLSRNEDLGHTL